MGKELGSHLLCPEAVSCFGILPGEGRSRIMLTLPSACGKDTLVF